MKPFLKFIAPFLTLLLAWDSNLSLNWHRPIKHSFHTLSPTSQTDPIALTPVQFLISEIKKWPRFDQVLFTWDHRSDEVGSLEPLLLQKFQELNATLRDLYRTRFPNPVENDFVLDLASTASQLAKTFNPPAPFGHETITQQIHSSRNTANVRLEHKDPEDNDFSKNVVLKVPISQWGLAQVLNELLMSKIAMKRWSQLGKEKEASELLLLPHVRGPYIYTNKALTKLVHSTPYLDGDTLINHLGAHKTPDTETVLDWLEQLIKGVSLIHQAKIIHRDISSENVYVLPNKKLMIIDFGISKTTEDPVHERVKNIEGTVGYMSLELLREFHPTSHDDLWALGVVFHQIIKGGKLPFSSFDNLDANYDAIFRNQPPLKVRDYEEDSTMRALANLVNKMFLPTRSERYQSAEEVLAALREIKQQHHLHEGSLLFTGEKPSFEYSL